MIWDVSKCINITRVQSPKQTFHTLKIIFCFLLFCTVHFSFVLCPLSISLPPSAPLFLSFIRTSVTLLRREPLSDLLAPPKNTKKIMPAELSLCWEKEGRRTQGERERREETRRKERTGGRKGGEGGREREKRDRGSGCSCSCGPGGELPSPGCSAETSMGGCVGSHHDSSGSLNENSDGTGGNLRGLSTSFIGHKLAFLFSFFFLRRASSRLPACCPDWRSSSLPFNIRARQSRRQTAVLPGVSLHAPGLKTANDASSALYFTKWETLTVPVCLPLFFGVD